ncbi:MAG: hypothetical protein EPO01_10460 [Aquabacterium sp.]|jgi:hypothetical protein|nr:MAG: hypothetical protein EPO12_11970 [Aquabacterium sp.]TAL21714.1 MAG: hypothetical protein EPO01_10460 [Aquabacterium sp.]
MQRQEIIANPFALMMDPESVVKEMERSERLARLQSRICRPLDKPLIPKVGEEEASNTGRYDAEVEAEPEIEAEDEVIVAKGELIL